ncbi:uncharacterized protein LOC120628806 [Pararge aegeria]|uniref:uncharacterized protein LOC120628806 n=1 Tax=Pararge aegeria TaxID=116150 RepID=UPI0019D30934|nr:uncharacterized protein LOC120628806 [Pararge aegeria]
MTLFVLLMQTWAESPPALVLNPSKSKYILFGSAKQLYKLRSGVSIDIEGCAIERVCKARNLGLLMDADLRFEEHLAEVVRNCFYRLKILYKVRQYLSVEVRLQLVEALVLSKLNYADVVFGPRLLCRTKRLIQRVQNACARFCFDIPPRTHVTPFLNNHHLLKMGSRRKLHLAGLLYGVIKQGLKFVHSFDRLEV